MTDVGTGPTPRGGRLRPGGPRPVIDAATSALLMVAAVVAPHAAEAQTPEQAIAQIEAAQPNAEPGSLGALTIEELLDSLNVPGLSVAVIHDFEIHWAKGYGIRDVATGEPVDTETIFQAASISKPVAELERFVGSYERRDDLPIVVDLQEGVLRVAPEGEGVFTLRPVGDATFRMEEANGEIVFDVTGGEVSGFLLRTGGTQRAWVRAPG